MQYQPLKNKCYRLSLLRIATDETLLHLYPQKKLTAELKDVIETGCIRLGFDLLPSGAQSLYVLHCEHLINGEPDGLLKSKGVRFLVVSNFDSCRYFMAEECKIGELGSTILKTAHHFGRDTNV